MSGSPDVVARTSPPSGAQALPQSQLAALLTEAYKELEVHRAEASLQRERAIKAEKLLKTLSLLRGHPISSPNPSNNVNGSTSSPSTSSTSAAHLKSASPSSPQLTSDDAMRLVYEYEERANRAEQERDEAVARRIAISDCWNQLHSHLTELDNVAVDVRLGFDRIVKENGGQLVLPKIPTLPGAESPHFTNCHRISRQPPPMITTNQFPSLPLPPLPVPLATSMRRGRTPSLDAYNAPPPTKRSRGEFVEHNHAYLSQSQHHTLNHTHPPAQQQQQQHHIHGQPLSQHHSPRMIFPPGPSSTSAHHLPPSTSSSRIHNPHPDQNNNHHHSRSRPTRSGTRQTFRKSRSHSRSSEASMSVDEMLLEITDGSQGNPPQPNHPSSNGHPGTGDVVNAHRVRRSESTRREQESHQQDTYEYPRQPPPQARYPEHPQPSAPAPPPPPAVSSQGRTQPATTQQHFQTHVFAPVVTGAPVKKAKFPGSTVAPSASTPALGGGGEGAPATYPPTNEQGQRICRQCGMPGRYKENKCVEKWGPGPMGPGTVCDRCRKKMKRVERRGTLEMQQQQAHSQQLLQRQHTLAQPQAHPHASQSQQVAAGTTGSSSSQAPIQRTDTLPAHHSPYGGSQLRSSGEDTKPYQSPRIIQTGSPHPPPPPSTNRRASTTSQPSQPGATKRAPSSPTLPGIMVLNEDDIPTSAIGRGSEAVASARGSRPSSVVPSKNGHHDGGGGRAAPADTLKRPGQKQGGASRNGSRKGSRSPAAMDVDAVDDADADADAEAEAEAEADIEAEIEGIVGLREKGVGQMYEADAEAYLLEAVDAAEANSVASSKEDL